MTEIKVAFQRVASFVRLKPFFYWFRILFGLLLFFSVLRFWYIGWIESLYINPVFHFKFYGFEWIKCPSTPIIYLLFIIQAVSSLLFAIGIAPAFFILLFCICFTYVELIDVTPYLNHYYLVSLLTCLLSFYRYKKEDTLNQWIVFAIKLQLSIVYFYGAIGKLNHDWLFEGQPLHLWLIGNSDMPFIGNWLIYKETAYIFSWLGCVFDLTIPFLLWYRPTAKYGYVLLVIFHLLTALLFQIGMFPWIMIISTSLFFDRSYSVSKLLFFPKKKLLSLKIAVIVIFISFQLLFPLRRYLYPGNGLWTEQGFRFAWDIMLIEKRGMIEYTVTDMQTGKKYPVDLKSYLTDFQIIMLSTQPDLILQFAHHLKTRFEKSGVPNVVVNAECFVSLNGHASKLYFDPNADLSKIYDNFAPLFWIYPYSL